MSTKTSLTITSLLFLSSAGTTLAQSKPGATPDLTLDAGTAGYFVVDLGLLIARLANVGLGITGLLLLGYLVWGGANWVLAGGDKSKVEAARSMITQAIVGFSIFASVFAIVGILFYFLGINGGPFRLLGLNQPQQYVPGSSNGGNGGSGGSGGSGTGTDICQVGVSASDGGAGGYCTGGAAANVKCQTTTGIPYAHWEPCSCQNGAAKAWSWQPGSSCP